jgi:hypothetical protein
MTDSSVQFARYAAAMRPYKPFFRNIDNKLTELQLIEKCISILTRTRDHLMHYPTGILDLTEEWMPLYRQFVFYFHEYSLENDHIALIDDLFIADCNVMICREPKVEVHETDFPKLAYELRILTCQHTMATRQPIDMQYATNLRFRIANFVTKFIKYDYDHKNIVAYAEQTCRDVDIRDAYYQLQFSSAAVHDEVLALKLKTAQNQINDVNLTPIDDFDVGDDDINRGEFFGELSSVAMRCFFIKSVGTFRCLEVEATLCNHFKMHQHIEPVTQPQLDSLRSWFERCCDIDVGNEFRIAFHNQAMEYMLPIGARLETERQASMVGEVEPVSNVTVAQLGVHVAGVLQKQTQEKFTSICRDRKHPMYEMLLLRMFTYMFHLDLDLDFWSVSYCVRPDILLNNPNEVMNRELDITRLPGTRRPIIFYLLKTWRLLHKRQWIVCQDVEHALLLWIRIVKEEFDAEMEGGQSIRRLWNKMFPKINHELMALKRKQFDQ